jgi:Ca2+-binding RTX toxin-like protein
MITSVSAEAMRGRHLGHARSERSCGPAPISPRSLALIGAVLAASATLLAAATAAARPTCLGHRATIVGNHLGNHIKGTPHADVIAALGGRDVVIGNGGRDIICGGGGRDRLFGGNRPNRLHRDQPTKLIGGPGNDDIHGSFASDFIVGDNASRAGDATGPVGRDHLDGDFGNDYIVGDNFSRFDARGGKHDVLLGQKGNDTMIGDSAVTGDGTARGGGNDHFESMSDKDFEVGDSYSPAGRAAGGGKDVINAGPQRDLVVGDSYTKTGIAIGSGRDQIHGRPGPDTLYGDNHAASRRGKVRGGKHDFIGGAGGIDHLYGGPAHDICNGGRGHHDSARQCEFVREVP